jgi:hypothetical protein
MALAEARRLRPPERRRGHDRARHRPRREHPEPGGGTLALEEFYYTSTTVWAPTAVPADRVTRAGSRRSVARGTARWPRSGR